MSGMSTNRWVGRLRGALLTTLAVFLITLAGLYLFGRDTTEPPLPEPGQIGGASIEALLASEGWEYEVIQEGRVIFSIRGERMISDRESNIILEGVGLTLFRDDGSSWNLECERGSYNKESAEAHLEGDVRVTTSMGLSLRTEGIIVAKGGRVFRSTASVHFQYLDQYEGRADELSVNQRSDFYLLSGNVEIGSLAGAETAAMLRSSRLIFDRPRRLVRALGNVGLEYGPHRLQARRLSATLTEDQREIQFIRALGVTASSEKVQGDGLGETISLGAATLSLVMDVETGTVRDLELKGRARRAATVTTTDATGLARQIQAPYIVSHQVTPSRRRFEAYEPVEFKEFFRFAPRFTTGWACADRAEIELQGNQLIVLRLDGNSELWRDSLYATGDTVVLDTDQGSTALTGQPARVLTHRGELEAPTILQIHYSGEIQAHGGIKGRMRRSGSALAGGEGPIQVEADEMVWRENPEQLLLTGDVQAWQDQQLLIADQLEENVEAARLEARGSVRTVWTPHSESATEEGGGEDDETRATGEEVTVEGGAGDELFPAPSASREPLEVTAERSVYDRLAGLVTYTGGSRARQGARSLACDELELELTESGEVRRLWCRDDVVIRDAEHRRTVRGDLASYDPAASEVRVSGERVTLKAEDGTTMVGPVMIYDFVSGIARIESERLLDIDLSATEDGAR